MESPKHTQEKQNITLRPDNTHLPTSNLPKPKIKIIPIILILFFLCITSVGAYFLGTKNIFKKNNTNNQNQNNPTSVPEETPLFIGKLKKLDQDLKLLKTSEDYGSKGSYYSAGVFNRGELQGYTRIIVIGEPSPATSFFILATKDFQTYILDDPYHLTNSPEDHGNNPYSQLDKNKISSVKVFDTYQPKAIKLDENTSLYYENIPNESLGTDQKDSYGNQIYESTINTDLSLYKSIKSPDKNLNFYYQSFSRPKYFDQWDQSSKNKQLLKEKYITTSTEILTTDPTGLPVVYIMAFSKNIADYQSQISTTDSYIQNPHLSFKKQISKIQMVQVFMTSTTELFLAIVLLLQIL
jgi:hypothetical protein